MDAVTNPYTPAAGARPPELAGRGEVREGVRIALERARRGMFAKSSLNVGLQGIGKTVLLDQMSTDAEAAGMQPVRIGASGAQSLAALLAPQLRLALLRLMRHAAARESAQRGLRALASFVKARQHEYRDIDVGLDFAPESGLADSGDLQRDLQDLLGSAAAAARCAAGAAVLFIDDMQFISRRELAALVDALPKCAERGLPVALVAAGLPQLRGQINAIFPYAERLLNFVEIGVLSEEAVEQAVRKPAADLGVQWEDGAVSHILASTHGHPYFLQELAKHAWDIATRSPITLRDTRNAALYALAALDENFFRPRIERLTSAERKYLRAMAELGPGPHRSGDIAAALGRAVTSVAPTRHQLIAKGMLWSPGHGATAFAVPRYDEYLRRTWPDESWRN